MKRKKTVKRLKIGKFERLLYVFTFLLLLVTPFVVVASQASLSKINIEVERIKKEIAAQERTNQGLEMKINELASLDKIQVIAQEKGLSYNNSNIKLIQR